MIPRTVRYRPPDLGQRVYGTLVAVCYGSHGFYGIVVTKEGTYDHIELNMITDGDSEAHDRRDAHRAIEMEFGDGKAG